MRPLNLVGLLFGGVVAPAFGDKFMLVMGSRFSQIRPTHPAVTLVYSGRSSSAAVRQFQSGPAFKKAGHHFQLVEDSAGFDTALKAGKNDRVAENVADANELNQRVSPAAVKPVPLPAFISKEEESAAQKKYHCLLKAPDDAENRQDAIDGAMELKLKRIDR